MEPTVEQLIAEFDPYSPEWHYITAQRQDQGIESYAGQRALFTTKRPDPDEEATVIVLLPSIPVQFFKGLPWWTSSIARFKASSDHEHLFVRLT